MRAAPPPPAPTPPLGVPRTMQGPPPPPKFAYVPFAWRTKEGLNSFAKATKFAMVGNVFYGGMGLLGLWAATKRSAGAFDQIVVGTGVLDLLAVVLLLGALGVGLEGNGGL